MAPQPTNSYYFDIMVQHTAIDKVQKIIDDINTHGNVGLTRLTVLKKWFVYPERLSAFGIWVAQWAITHAELTDNEHLALLDEARILLESISSEKKPKDSTLKSAHGLHKRLHEFQNEIKNIKWSSVRLIHCWPLFLVEKGLAIYLGISNAQSDGYRLAVSFAKNYDSRYGAGLNGPSQDRLKDLLHFMLDVELTTAS